ncbi:hypothetical protein HMPREF9104_02217 [Lentilactobacillus kisonensis F0435]|uniref:Uncharacterized protein n=1 Tax=Lentilactobacillus kisonensis F0435 TaxID=797516 RepID=H1LHX6_9LACO|nr:hypothetical protein HMPREF9104_02217 [Lentilactobacillus kisonensis F0435]
MPAALTTTLPVKTSATQQSHHPFGAAFQKTNIEMGNLKGLSFMKPQTPIRPFTMKSPI